MMQQHSRDLVLHACVMSRSLTHALLASPCALHVQSAKEHRYAHSAIEKLTVCMPMMILTDHIRKQHVSIWNSSAMVKAEIAMSHMAACFVVWQTAFQNWGAQGSVPN